MKPEIQKLRERLDSGETDWRTVLADAKVVYSDTSEAWTDRKSIGDTRCAILITLGPIEPEGGAGTVEELSRFLEADRGNHTVELAERIRKHGVKGAK